MGFYSRFLMLKGIMGVVGFEFVIVCLEGGCFIY